MKYHTQVSADYAVAYPDTEHKHTLICATKRAIMVLSRDNLSAIDCDNEHSIQSYGDRSFRGLLRAFLMSSYLKEIKKNMIESGIVDDFIIPPSLELN